MGWLLGEGCGCQKEGVLLVAFLFDKIQVLQTASAFGVVFCEVFILKVLMWFQVTHTRVSMLC